MLGEPTVNWRHLIACADLEPIAAAPLALPSLPADGLKLLGMLPSACPQSHIAVVRESRIAGDLRLTSYEEASGPWYGDRGVGVLLWRGDLVVEGDLLDEAFDQWPVLVIQGDLIVRNWLRGGMAAFVGGSVRASGFVSTTYDDSALFVGGDFDATGFIHHPKTYPDFRDIVIHQVAGALSARTLALHYSEADPDMRTIFVPEVLIFDEGMDCHWFDNQAIFQRAAAGLPVWAG
jgi:hypothetical protein